MVAAGAEVGDLRLGPAWALLLAVIAGVSAIVVLHGATMLYRRAPLALPPSALAQKAAEIRRAVGLDDEAADTAFWLEPNRPWLDHMAATPSSRSRKGGLSGSPHALLFHHRSSPQPMVATRQGGENRIDEDDPPFTTPGMAWIVLDAHGRLLRLARVPTPRGEGREHVAAADPAPLLAFAGLEARSLVPASPRLVAPVDNDSKLAFTGSDPMGGDPLRVEIAWLRGRPVWFSVSHAWAETTVGERARAEPTSAAGRLALVVNVGFLIVIPIGAWLLAVRNVRRRRVDRRGTLRLSVSYLLVLLVARVLRADHVPTFVDEWSLLSYLVAECVFWSASVGVFYVAVEPYVRRRWPAALVSWTRLVAGRLGDPMVGRDVLLGFLAGLLVLLAWHLSVLAPERLGGPPPLPLPLPLTPLAEARHVGYYLLRNLGEAVFRAFGLLALLVLLRGVLRSQRAAVAAVFVPLAASFLGDTTAGPLFRLAYVGVAAAVAIAVLLRYGLLSLCACAFLILTLRRLPLTFDLESWYLGRSVVALTAVAGLSLWAFGSVIRGQPVFGRPLFED
jgi:hypothetical protein